MDAANEMLVGRAHAFVYDIVSVHEWHTKNPDRTRLLHADLGNEDYCTALRKGSPLVAQVNALPRELSGRPQQRVAIARALAMDRAVMLFDAPTRALDPETVGEVLAVLRDLDDGGMTMVIVTHETAFARDVSTRTVFMDAGRIVERGPPRTVFATPGSARLRDFLTRLRRDA